MDLVAVRRMVRIDDREPLLAPSTPETAERTTRNAA